MSFLDQQTDCQPSFFKLNFISLSKTVLCPSLSLVSFLLLFAGSVDLIVQSGPPFGRVSTDVVQGEEMGNALVSIIQRVFNGYLKQLHHGLVTLG